MPRTTRVLAPPDPAATPDVRLVRLDTLRCDPDNVRVHPEQNLRAIRESLTAFGQQRPLVVMPDGLVLAGNGTLEAARQLGWSHIAVQVCTLPLDQARAYAVADNRTGELSSWNETGLATLLRTLQAQELPLPGWDEAELRKLCATPLPEMQEGDVPIDRGAELREQYGVHVGQLWTCGPHRVMCGDSTDKAVVERVMQQARYRLLVTSPPYLDLRDYTQPIADWQALAVGFMSAAVAYCDAPGDILVSLGVLHRDGMVYRYHEPWLDACAALGWPLYGWYVWDKLNGFPGEWNGRLAPCHEWLFHFSQAHTSAHKWVETNGTANRRGASGSFRKRDGTLQSPTSPEKYGQLHKIPDSVLRFSQEQARGVHTQNHPAVFPVALPAFCLQTWSEPNDLVYDPFIGSGTTLIAAHQLGRVCRGVDISPEYIAVCLERFLRLTNQTPVLVEP